jgi:hypothetical protein
MIRARSWEERAGRRDRIVPSPGRARLAFLGVLATLAASAGCGTTEESGEIGDTLTAKGLEVTVEEVDASVPANEGDVTGLSEPSAGAKLVGVRVNVCSEQGGAIGPYSFGVEADSDDQGRLKYPQRNYRTSFDSVREDCAGGWIVFEIPEGSRPERVSFEFENTGSARHQQDDVHAEFSWTVGG